MKKLLKKIEKNVLILMLMLVLIFGVFAFLGVIVNILEKMATVPKIIILICMFTYAMYKFIND